MVLGAKKQPAAADSVAAEKAKAQGNEAFKAKKFDAAIEAYTQAINLDGGQAAFYGNRSAAHLGRGTYAEALADAEQCVRLDPAYLKGYHRVYTAAAKLESWARACAAIEAGSKHESKKKVFTQAMRARAAEGAYCADAESALRAGKLEDAQRLVRAGQRIDFRNEKLAELARRVGEAEVQAAAAARAGMTPAELARQDGNALFKESAYEAAIGKYSDALRLLGEADGDGAAGSDLAIACFNNRAACYQQVSDFDNVVRDTTRVLGAQPGNAKALLRRGLALEGLEQYERAMQDVRRLLLDNPRFDAANKLKNRLQAAMRRQKDLAACERS